MKGKCMAQRLVLAFFLASSFCLGAAVASPGTTTDQTEEEKLLRFAYTKLNWYLQREALLDAEIGKRYKPASAEIVGDVVVGQLKDILDRRLEDFVTPPADKTPQMARIIVSGPDGNGPGHVGFQTRWARYPMEYGLKWGDPALTVGKLLHRLLGPKRWPTYASFTVRVFAAGRTETYKALATFGPPGPSETAIKTFGDYCYATGHAAQAALEEEGPVIPTHYWRTGELLREAGAFGHAGPGGESDTPRCTAADESMPCYGIVCCGANGCCWRSAPKEVEK
jgi:hypothetical protein